MYAAFVQDQWRALSRLTINAGLRWDYEKAPGISHDRNNVAPRLGISYDLTGSATTVVRGSYGLYYDQVFLNVAREVEQAAGLVLSRIDNPGYPDPRGSNPRGPYRAARSEPDALRRQHEDAAGLGAHRGCSARARPQDR